MGEPVTVGVDFGSMGIRAARIDEGGQVVTLTDLPAPSASWLLCEPATSSFGIAFPSVKARLGTVRGLRTAGDQRGPHEVVASAFRSLREAVEARTSRRAGRAVVAVPARYLASQRVALRDIVLAAGFAEAHLINDSMAAVMEGAVRGGETSTTLVFSSGYAGFEVALVRAMRGHYRALGYEGGPVPGGQALDEWLLRELFEALARHNVPPVTAGWDAGMWTKVRTEAQRIKETLSTHGEVSLRVRIAGVARPIRFSRTGLENAVDQWLQTALGHVERLLEQTGVRTTHVDGVVLVGGTARIPFVQSAVEKMFGVKPWLAEADVLARGAARYASKLADLPVAADVDVERTEALAEEASEVPVVQPGTAVIVEASEPATDGASAELALQMTAPAERPPKMPTPPPSIDHARELIERGHDAAARALLEGLIRDAQALLARIAERRVVVDPRSPRAIARAGQFLKDKHYELAVRESHLAWQASADSAEIFEQMIDIHCLAATANTAIDTYADATRWLLCAYGHDKGNMRVRQLLSERHYIQAKQLAERGRRKDAVLSLDECLALDPEHQLAKELQQTLTRR